MIYVWQLRKKLFIEWHMWRHKSGVWSGWSYAHCDGCGRNVTHD